MKAKVMLAKLLLQDSDCLLLDEPTNFLDVKHIDFLAQYLNNYPKAFIVISHDEGFIKKIARTIYAIESKKIERYKGDLDYYMRERQLRFDIKEKAFETQKQKIDKEQTFIQKNIARASTTKRAQSRRKMLDKIVKVDAPNKSKTYTFNFPFSGRSGDIVLNVENLSVGYEGPLLDSIDLELRRQMKLAITGKNGIGKSTFLKTLLSEIDPIDGSFTWSDTAEIIYFSQTLHIDEKMTAYQYIRLFYTYEDEQFIYQLLASYGITYEMANRGLLTLSGGEQTKVRLAVLKKQKSNVLILDEPTNHLDASAKQALVDAMQAYQGTLVLVSHETDIYQDVCDELMELY
jgi:ATPase subunit of ABC transporter with duplicated ATPase domains